MRTRYLIFILCLLFIDCSASRKMSIVTNDRGEAIAVGECTQQELFSNFPEYRKVFLAYQSDSAGIARLKVWSKKVEVFTILGTWCSDSRREVPRLIKIFDETKTPVFQLRFLCVDRSKRDKRGIAASYDIRFVPTIIVLFNGKEIGRIIEKPKTSLEADLLAILATAESAKK